MSCCFRCVHHHFLVASVSPTSSDHSVDACVIATLPKDSRKCCRNLHCTIWLCRFMCPPWNAHRSTFDHCNFIMCHVGFLACVCQVPDSQWESFYKPLWLASAFLNSGYSYFWDLERDWEIQTFTARSGANLAQCPAVTPVQVRGLVLHLTSPEQAH